MATPPGSPGSFTLHSDEILDFAKDISKHMLLMIANRVAVRATNSHAEQHCGDDEDLIKVKRDQQNAFFDRYSEWINPVACTEVGKFLDKNRDKMMVVQDGKEPAAAMLTNQSKSIESGGINTSSNAYKLLQVTAKAIATDTIEKAADFHIIRMQAALFPHDNKMSEKVKKFCRIEKPRFIDILTEETNGIAVTRLNEFLDHEKELRDAKRKADEQGGAGKKVKKEDDQ
tara:strand:- start:10739 stop:11425 length:687 start_codon:yes stop_codon:yes gene_type:complete